MTGTTSAGTKGFLFCDLRGYTAFIERSGDQAAAELLATYREMVRAVIAAHEGAEIRTEGDSLYVVFPAASGAVEAGLGIVAGAKGASTKDRPIAVGVGVHAGETVATTEGLVGGAVNIAARVCAKAQAGEVLVTDTVRALTRTYLPYTYTSLGTQSLKGIAGGIPLYRVEAVPTSGRARLRRQLGARRGRLALLGGAVAILAVGAVGAWAVNRPADCLTLPASTKDVVARIDPDRGCVVAVYRTGFRPGPIVAAAGEIWVANLDDQTVTRIEPNTGDTHTTSGHGFISALAASDDAVWTLDGRYGQITEITTADGKAINDFVLPSTPPGYQSGVTTGLSVSPGGRDPGHGYEDVAVGSGRVWVSSRKEGDVLRIDPRQDEFTNSTRFSVVRPPPPVKDSSGSLTWPGTGVGKLAFDSGTLWIADTASGQLWRTDPGSTGARSLGVAGDSGAIDVVASSGVVWITHADGTLTRTAIDSGRSELLTVGKQLGDAAADGNGLWIADALDHSAINVDHAGTVLKRIELAGRPQGVALADGSLWMTIQ